MKPLPFTDEDKDVVASLVFHRRGVSWLGSLMVTSYEADRRDASRMLALRESRLLCDKSGVTHCIVAGWETALSGYDDPDRSLMEQGLAAYIPKLPVRYR